MSAQDTPTSVSKTRGEIPDNILRKQWEEADVLVLNKIDLLSANERERIIELLWAAYPGRPVTELSARTGESVDDWLNATFEGDVGGRHIAAMDYDTYAGGEAALGWLNAKLNVTADRDVDFARLAESLLESLRAEVAENRQKSLT